MRRFRELLTSIITIVLLVGTAGVGVAQQPKLALNDVSWLWPVPATVDGLERTISMDSLKRSDGTPVWSDAQFRNLLQVVEDGATEVGGHTVEI